MRFGLSGCGAGFESAPLEEIGDWASFAEGLGFTGLWINEEHFQRHGRDRRTCLSPIVLATALAARTRRIRLGFSVLLLALHHPLRLAEEIATLDVLSGGRVDFGISRGNSSRYLSGYGIDADNLTDRFRDTLQFILDCWAGEPVVTSEGPQAVEPRPIQMPHPPVFIGGYSEESVRWAGSGGHHLIQHGIQSLDTVRRNLQLFASAGGDVSAVPVGRFIYVSRSDESARAEAWPVVCALTERLRTIGIHRRGLIISEAELEPERFYAEVAIVGSPATCAERIGQLRTTLGIQYVNLLAAFFGLMPPDLERASLTRFAEEVMPALDHDPASSATTGASLSAALAPMTT
jgi:alkanesulfonate monooxygenase SsuD/methylene tetrahydromethanopterin reductase-like flavin-dependent oxidoreductase (luciferase family)